MDEDALWKLYKRQLEIEEEISSEFSKFKKNNSERKKKVADKLYLKIRGLKLELLRNHEVLSKHKVTLTVKNKTYLTLNVYGRCEKAASDFVELLRQFISSSIVADKKPDENLNISSDIEKDEQIMSNDEEKYENLKVEQDVKVKELENLSADFNKLSEEEKVAERGTFLTKLDKLKETFDVNNQKLEQLREGREEKSYFFENIARYFEELHEQVEDTIELVEAVEKKNEDEDGNKTDTRMEEALKKLVELQAGKTSVQMTCSKFIVTFDPKNVRAFMNSVHDCLDEFESEEDKKKVLRYAKNRVSGSPVVAASEFKDFEEFEKLMNQQFKPVKNHLQLNQEITLMMQKSNESVGQFGNRAAQLKADYIEALYSAYKANAETLPISRMQEGEALVTKHFVLGLKIEIKINIRTEPKSLTEAIGLAEAAATAAGLAEVSKSFNEMKRASNNKYSRGSHYQRGNFRGGRGHYSGHNSPSASKNSDEKSGQNESKGCWACGDEGHRKFECPNKSSVSRAGRGGFATRPKNGQSASSAQVSALSMQGRSQQDCE